MINEIVNLDNTAGISSNDYANLSALLSLLHGKNDSICKLFMKEINVDLSKLKTLNEMIQDKLNLHEVMATAVKVDVSLSNKKIISFKSWIEFEKYDFQKIVASTRSIFIQWDLLLQLPGYEIPQRHTVSIRISSSPRPADLLRAMLEDDDDRYDDIEIQSSTMICRVDFINSTLAEELINVAEKWNDLCETATSEKSKFYKFVYKKRSHIAYLTELSSIVLFSIFLSLIIKYLFVKCLIQINLETIIYLIVFSSPILSCFRYCGHQFGQKVFNKLSNIMEIHIFAITNGDEKTNIKLKHQRNLKKEVAIFIANIIISILLSIVFFMID